MPRSPEQQAAFEAKLDHFADLLSEGLSTVEIRERMGMTNGSAQRLMMMLRKRLGWQAR